MHALEEDPWDNLVRVPTLPGDDAEPSTVQISATPFVWKEPSSIPLRPWVFGRWLLRNTITAVVAPGGIGKSSFMASTVLALTTGRQLLGKTVWDGPQRAWYWNLEDDAEELDRQIIAAALHHGIQREQFESRLFVDSGLEGAELCVAVSDGNGFRILKPVIDALVGELTRKQIDVLVVDPFVSSHSVQENDNGAIDAVAKEWGRVAKRANCSVVLVHHTKKPAGQRVTAEMSRGASALINAARIALVLNRMENEEATRFGIEDDGERRRHFNVQDDKHNRAPAEEAEWYRLASVDLGNGQGASVGDNIGVAARWFPPDAFEGVTVDHLRKVQVAVAAGDWRKDPQADDWVGKAVADTMGLDLIQATDKARVKRLLSQWINNAALKVETRHDKGGVKRPFIVVGRWADDLSPPRNGVVEIGGEVEKQFSTTTSHKREVGGGGEAAAVSADPKAKEVRDPLRGMILAPGETGDDVDFG